MKPINLPKNFSAVELAQSMQAMKRACQPYYNEQSARQAERILRTLHSSGQPLQIQLGGSKLTTVRLKYYSGVQYLLDNLDPTGELKELYKRSECQAKTNGLLIIIRNAPRTPSLENFIIVQASWREELSKFIENSVPDEQFFKPNLSLTDDDMTWINSQLIGMVKKGPDGEEVPLFYGEIKNTQILLIRDKD